MGLQSAAPITAHFRALLAEIVAAKCNEGVWCMSGDSSVPREVEDCGGSRVGRDREK